MCIYFSKSLQISIKYYGFEGVEKEVVVNGKKAVFEDGQWILRQSFLGKKNIELRFADNICPPIKKSIELNHSFRSSI